jgi:hypothetical protein
MEEIMVAAETVAITHFKIINQQIQLQLNIY